MQKRGMWCMIRAKGLIIIGLPSSAFPEAAQFAPLFSNLRRLRLEATGRKQKPGELCQRQRPMLPNVSFVIGRMSGLEAKVSQTFLQRERRRWAIPESTVAGRGGDCLG
jgi:hypothetical protein